jgi:hypothetical protein
MSSGLAVGDHVLAFYWTRSGEGDDRWSKRRRRHRVTSVEPLQGVEYWHEHDSGYVEGQEHRLNLEQAKLCDSEDEFDTGRHEVSQSASRRRLEPVYGPPGADGEIIVYAGDLLVATEQEEHTVPGQLELRLAPRSTFTAHVAGDLARLSFLMRPNQPDVSLPPDAHLDPPTESGFPERLDGTSWVDRSILLNRLAAGDFGDAERFVLHVSGAMSALLPTVEG